MRKGFTVSELCIVLCLIGIFIAAVVANYDPENICKPSPNGRHMWEQKQNTSNIYFCRYCLKTKEITNHE